MDAFAQHTTDIRVRYAETDAMGWVHHSVHIVWFEAARIRLMDAIGLNYVQMEADGFQLPLLEAHVNYKAPAKFDDELHVTIGIVGPVRARVRAEYTIHREDTLLATGHTVHAFIDATGRAIKPPEFFLKAIGA